jgi:hypothetical protein
MLLETALRKVNDMAFSQESSNRTYRMIPAVEETLEQLLAQQRQAYPKVTRSEIIQAAILCQGETISHVSPIQKFLRHDGSLDTNLSEEQSGKEPTSI